MGIEKDGLGMGNWSLAEERFRVTVLCLSYLTLSLMSFYYSLTPNNMPCHAYEPLSLKKKKASNNIMTDFQ